MNYCVHGLRHTRLDYLTFFCHAFAIILSWETVCVFQKFGSQFLQARVEGGIDMRLRMTG